MIMARMSANFDSGEFDCRDGTAYPKAWYTERLKPLCRALEVLRKELDKPITISSGYRTEEYNKKIGGARKSQHVHGLAADITVKGIPARKVHQVLLDLIHQGKVPNGGVGQYPSFTHYDQRGAAARWGGSRKRN